MTRIDNVEIFATLKENVKDNRNLLKTIEAYGTLAFVSVIWGMAFVAIKALEPVLNPCEPHLVEMVHSWCGFPYPSANTGKAERTYQQERYSTTLVACLICKCSILSSDIEFFGSRDKCWTGPTSDLTWPRVHCDSFNYFP